MAGGPLMQWNYRALSLAVQTDWHAWGIGLGVVVDAWLYALELHVGPWAVRVGWSSF